MVTPNLDELAAMAAAASASQTRHVIGNDAKNAPQSSRSQDHSSSSYSSLSSAENTQDSAALGRAGHKLAEAAISPDGQFVDARPLGDALKAVLTAMVHDGDNSATALSTSGGGGSSRDPTCPADTHRCSSSSAQSEPVSCSSLNDGSKHVVVTMGVAGVLVASGSPADLSVDDKDKSNGGGGVLVKIPTRSGSWFTLSAHHYPALPLPARSGGRAGVLVDCTGAGDCLAAGMVGGLSLGWEMRDSVLLGLVRNGSIDLSSGPRFFVGVASALEW